MVEGATGVVLPLGNDTDPNPLDRPSVVAGIFTSLDRGATVTCTIQQCSYASVAGFVGNDRFNYQITDGELTATATVFVSIIAFDIGPSCVPFIRTLTNGNVSTTDRTAAIDVDGKGSFINARYNPDGPTPEANTVYRSSLFVGPPVSNFLTDSCSMTIDAAQSSASKLVTNGTINGLGLGLTQELLPSDAAGSTLEQSYTFTNSSASAINTRLVRNLDGDLFFDGRKIDGAAATVDGSTLYEFDNTDVPSSASDVISISGSVGGNTVPSAWTIQQYVPTRLDAVSASIHRRIANDANGDRITDSAYDVVMTQQWNVTIPAGGSINFVTRTRFGKLSPNIVNVGPVAVDDARSTPSGTPLVVTGASLVSNDTDVDGETLTVTAVSGATNGVVALSDDSVTFTPTTGFVGTAGFDYTVSDGSKTAVGHVTVTVIRVNHVPVAVNDSATVAEDDTAIVSVLGNDSGLEDTPLAVTVTNAAHGTVTVNLPANTVTYTPAANFNGTDSFTYTVKDADNQTSTATVNMTVTPVNDLPVAVEDARSTPSGTQLVVMAASLATNDTDIDGDALTVTAVSGATNGVVVLLAGSVTFTPTPGFVGTAGFDYTVTDGLRTAVGHVTVTVTPVNHVPIAVNDSVTVAEDGTVTVSVLGNDSGLEDAPLTVTATNPAHGTVTVNTQANTVTYAPAENFHGTDSFTYTVKDVDNQTSTATVTLTVTPVNDTPVAENDTATTNEDTAATIGVLSNDSGLGDGPFTVIAGSASHGAVTVNVPTNTVTYVPAANYSGPDSFAYTARDVDGQSSTATVAVTIVSVNDTPVAVNDTATTNEDTLVTVSVLSNDTGLGDGPFTLSSGSATHGTVTVNLPANTVSYTPAANFNGTDSFTYTVKDTDNQTSTASVNMTVTPVNDLPVAVEDARSTPSGTQLIVTAASLAANDTDIDGDALTVTAVSGATNGVVVLLTGSVTFTPTPGFVGTAGFDYTVTDGLKTAVGHVTVAVTVAAIRPVVKADFDASLRDVGFPSRVVTLWGSFSSPVPGPYTAAVKWTPTGTYTPFVLNSASRFVAAFVYPANGTYVATVRICGSGNLCGTDSVTMRVGVPIPTPVVECVTDRGRSTSPRYEARFAYQNSGSVPVIAPKPLLNYFSPFPFDRRQPEFLRPGTVSNAVRATFDNGTLTWSIYGFTATARTSSPRC